MSAEARGRFTDDDRAYWRELGRRSRREQGLPEKITDPLVLDQAATLIGPYLLDATQRPAA